MEPAISKSFNFICSTCDVANGYGCQLFGQGYDVRSKVLHAQCNLKWHHVNSLKLGKLLKAHSQLKTRSWDGDGGGRRLLELQSLWCLEFTARALGKGR